MLLGTRILPGRVLMTDQQILDTLSRILSDLLGDESIVLKMELARADVPGWDSFNYVNFIVAVESQLNVKFNLAEIESFENVGAIVSRTKAMLQ